MYLKKKSLNLVQIHYNVINFLQLVYGKWKYKKT